MKHLKLFESFEDQSLKQRLTDYYHTIESDYDPEEISNVLDILNEYDDNLTNLGKWDKTLLLRLVDDSDLYQEVDSLGGGSEPKNDSNLFEDIILEKNSPTNSSLWQSCVAWAKSKYDVWPSAYACGAAAKRYKSKGGKWKKSKK